MLLKGEQVGWVRVEVMEDVKGSESERGRRGFYGKGKCMSGGGEYG